MDLIFVVSLLMFFLDSKTESKTTEEWCKCDNIKNSSASGRIIEPKIYNGSDVDGTSLEYVAAIFVKANVSEGFVVKCTGVLINPLFVLTSANCVNLFADGASSSKIYVASGGDFKLTTHFKEAAKSNAENSVVREVAGRYVFPENPLRGTNFSNPFNIVTNAKKAVYEHDLMILEMSEPFQFGDRTNQYPACLYPEHFNASDPKLKNNLLIAGFGEEGEYKNKTTKYEFELGKEPVRLNAGRKLRWAPTEAGQMARTWVRIIQHRLSSMCPNDTGGPLLYQENGKLYVIGILSVAAGCYKSESGFVQEIYPFIGWIESFVIHYNTMTEEVIPKMCTDIEKWLTDAKSKTERVVPVTEPSTAKALVWITLTLILVLVVIYLIFWALNKKFLLKPIALNQPKESDQPSIDNQPKQASDPSLTNQPKTPAKN